MILLGRLLLSIKHPEKNLKICYKWCIFMYILIKFGIKNDRFHIESDVIAAHLPLG